MDIKVSEVNGKLICKKYDHNEQIIMIAMEEQYPIQERFLCVKCLQSNRNIVKILGIDQVKEMIKEKQSQQQQQSIQQQTKDLQIIKQFQQKMKSFQTKLLKDLEEIQRISQQWIKEYDQIENETQLVNLIKGLEQLNKPNFKNDIELIDCINQSYFIKLFQKLDMIQATIELDQSYDLLFQLHIDSKQTQKRQQSQQQIKPQIKIKQVKNQQIIQNQQDKKQSISQVKLINSIKQEESCYAIAFNNNGQIMITGCGKDIKVWKFEKGQMIEKKKLNGHTEKVCCLIISQRINLFASGSDDKTIRCWKEQTNGEWISTEPGQQHTHWIRCLLLNCNEDELISCSDKTIKVWKVNCQSNQLDYNYTLDQKHTGFVYCISMNEQETYLVSCSSDQTIILWNKDNQNQWKYQNKIVNDDYGYRLCFISDYQIIWQQKGKGITHFFEIKNAQLTKRPELNIQLNQESGDHGLFPTIFNKKKQIIVQSHNRYVYLLKKQENDQLALASDPIDCNHWGNHGSLTVDGEYLVVWDNGTKEIRVHQIQYK